MNTLGTTQTALDNHIDQLVSITGQLTPVLGSLGHERHNFVPAFNKIGGLTNRFFDNVWLPERDIGNLRVNPSFTPSYSTRGPTAPVRRAQGPSCYTAPLVAVRPTSRGAPAAELPAPKNLTPPRERCWGPTGIWLPSARR